MYAGVLTVSVETRATAASAPGDDARGTHHDEGDEEGEREAGEREAGEREAGEREAGEREAGEREAGEREEEGGRGKAADARDRGQPRRSGCGAADEPQRGARGVPRQGARCHHGRRRAGGPSRAAGAAEGDEGAGAVRSTRPAWSLVCNASGEPGPDAPVDGEDSALRRGGCRTDGARGGRGLDGIEPGQRLGLVGEHAQRRDDAGDADHEIDAGADDRAL